MDHIVQEKLSDDESIRLPVTPTPPSKPKLTKYHYSGFATTFLAYACFHAIRKSFSNVKKTMSSQWGPVNTTDHSFYPGDQWNRDPLFDDQSNVELFLASLDTAFMCAYSIGLFISGMLGDRYSLRKVLAFGMISSAIAAFFFGTFSEWAHVYSIYYYYFFWILTGFLQSSGWPTVVAIVGNWFDKSSRGFVMGVWGASPSVGNILGSYVASFVLPYGYEYAFFVPAAVTVCGGIIVYFSLVSSPKEVGLPETTENLSEDNCPLLSEKVPAVNEQESDASSIEKAPPLGFFKAFRLPGVIPYSLAYACLKLVNYSFFFWLPYYLQSTYGWSEEVADGLSIWYDVGGILGSIACGLLSDLIGSRSPVVALLLVFSPASIYGYYCSPPKKLPNCLLMALTGFFIGGAANLISTAVAADLGKQKELNGNSEALATVTGIIDGTGSAGAAFGQLMIPYLKPNGDWTLIFYIFMAMPVLTLLCIIKIVIVDIKELVSGRAYRRRHRTTDARLHQVGSYS